LSFEFALQIIEFCELLEKNKKYVIAKQLLKAGTSIGANVWESQSPESKADFIHKLKIAAKEASETEYWMLICEKVKSYPSPSNEMQSHLLSIQKLLSKIIASTKYSKK
jgi:four helix bundle protein